MKCSYCDEPAVTTSGKSYCVNHLSISEKVILEEYLIGLSRKKEGELIIIDRFFLWAFGTTEPKLSDIPKLYGRFPRGKWDEKKFLKGEKGFDVPQETYVRRCYLAFLRKEQGK